MKDILLPFVLQNAIDHGGKASFGSIMGKAMTIFPELKKDPKEASNLVKDLVGMVNSLSLEEQKEKLEEVGEPIQLERRRREGLPELERAAKGDVRMRFAPGPSGPLHIGHTRAAVLNDIYCSKYDGDFILRFEDTNPEKIDPAAYDMIPEDLEWLGVDISETYVQSDRFDIYYGIVETLIDKGEAYICTMDPERWRELKAASRSCPERDMDPGYHMDGWKKMLDGTYAPAEASLVIKTDLYHKNPAVRDFVGMRINETPHPITGDKYRVYPLYNLSVAIDDHLMGCTHILRGKDHLNNTYRQEYVYRHLGWELPEFIHYGLVSIPDTILKTSLIREEIVKGTYSGWGDIRTGTLRALSSRGIRAEALRRYWEEVGMKSVDITLSWDNLYSMNKEIIEKTSKRFFFVPEPKEIKIMGIENLEASIPYLPDKPDLGSRKFHLQRESGAIKVCIPAQEIGQLKEGDLIRLKDLCNVQMVDENKGIFNFAGHGMKEVRSRGGSIIQWLPPSSRPCRLMLPDGSMVSGICEAGVEKEASSGGVIQFERVGFFKLDMDDEGIIGKLTHK